MGKGGETYPTVTQDAADRSKLKTTGKVKSTPGLSTCKIRKLTQQFDWKSL
jgi:hypothetical protein